MTAERKRKPSPTINGVDIKPEKWTWQQAEEALTHNITNRHIREASVNQYKRLMAEGLWGAPDAKQGYRASTQPVIFDWDGNLIDGQHRLYAQVRAKISMYHYVLRDVPPSTQRYIDLGPTRSAADGLKILGYQNYIILSTVSRWAWLLEQEMATSGSIKVSNDEVYDMIQRHPDLTHSAEVASHVSRTIFFSKVLGPTPLGAAHWWIAQHNDHAEADMFFDRCARMNGEADGSAILALWTRLSGARTSNERIKIPVQIAMIIKAWNLDCERGFVHRIPSKSRTGEYKIPEVLVRTESQEDAYGPLPDADEENVLLEGEGELDAGEEEEPEEGSQAS